MSRLSSPMWVTMPPPSVPRWMVTNSRTLFRFPILVCETSPLYFRSSGATRHLCHRSLSLKHGQLHAKLIAGDDRLAELGVFNRDQQHQLGVPVLDTLEDEHTRGLRHGLHNQHAWHDWEIRKMAVKEG